VFESATRLTAQEASWPRKSISIKPKRNYPAWSNAPPKAKKSSSPKPASPWPCCPHSVPEQPAESDQPKIYRTFGNNVLGITFLADDWEEDIPLEYFEDEGEENLFGEVSDEVASE
jgi:hypothetical protein